MGSSQRDAQELAGRHIRSNTCTQLMGNITRVLDCEADLGSGPEKVRRRHPREPLVLANRVADQTDRKSTRLNSSHVAISYAVFCLKKKRTRCIRALHVYAKLRSI